MKDFESLAVISVEHTTVMLTLPGLHAWKWLTVENIRKVIKCITLL